MNCGPHRPELDDFTPAEMRVLLEQMLYTMEHGQREKLKAAHPAMYERIYPPKDTGK
jgi:hypothetical protein